MEWTRLSTTEEVEATEDAGRWRRLTGEDAGWSEALAARRGASATRGGQRQRELDRAFGGGHVMVKEITVGLHREVNSQAWPEGGGSSRHGTRWLCTRRRLPTTVLGES